MANGRKERKGETQQQQQIVHTLNPKNKEKNKNDNISVSLNRCVAYRLQFCLVDTDRISHRVTFTTVYIHVPNGSATFSTYTVFIIHLWLLSFIWVLSLFSGGRKCRSFEICNAATRATRSLKLTCFGKLILMFDFEMYYLSHTCGSDALLLNVLLFLQLQFLVRIRIEKF